MGREIRPPGRARPGGLDYLFIAGCLLVFVPIIKSQDDGRDYARSAEQYERVARSVPQVGLLESTARTFVLDGASTEYATQVVGTTLDNGLYTRILATSSRVFYDKDSIVPESASPYLVYPSRVDQDKWKVLNGIVDETPIIHQEITSSTSSSSSSSSSGPSNESVDRENDIFEIRREFNGEHQKFKPAKPRINLPTYTVKQELTGALGSIGGYDNEEAEARSFRPRVPKIFKPQAIRLLQKKEPTKPLATVTYHGFADFTTTVGDTVIVFSPSTAPPAVGRAATTIKGDATLRPDHGNVISIQPTNAIRGQDKTSDPLLDAINGRSPGKQSLRPSVQQEEMENSSAKQTPILLVPTDEMKPTGLLKVLDSTTAVDGTTTHYKSSIFGTYIGTNYAQIIHTSSNVYFFPDESTATIDDYVTNKPEETESTEDILTTFGTVDSTTPMAETEETVVPEDNELTTVEEITDEVNSITVMKVETTTPMDPEIPNDIVDPQGRSIKGNSKNRLGEEKIKEFSTILLPSEVYKTFTYYTTFFIPDETNADLTTTSVRSREVVSSEVTYLTELIPSVATSSPTTIRPSQVATLSTPLANPKIINEKGEEEEPTTKREEIELIFKTLYTTYTYLTTFFQESTSSVASREVVETNVVTQTIGPDGISGDVVGLFNDDIIITPTKVQEIPKTTALTAVTEEFEDFPTTFEDTTAESSFTTLKDDEEGNVDVVSQLEPSPMSTLVPDTLKAETKTYFTTYTYFTTIFVDDETEIETRTEVFSNIVTEPFEPTAVAPPPDRSETQIPTTPKSQPAPPPEILAYLEALKKQKSQDEALKLAKKVQDSVHTPPTTTPTPEENPTTMPIITEEPDDVTEQFFEDGEVLGSMITDVVSSSSSSDGPVLEPSMDKRNAGSIFEDQELSESNHHDVEPAPTLLLRTSYTTFTYFTTMYKGDASNVVSRLQTVTNIVTETIRPTPAMEMVEPTSTLPVTYFTTFTYWTTFYKGGDTITTSREDTVSNVVTPGVSPTPTVQLGVIMTYRPDTVAEDDLVTEKAITDNEVMQHDKATAQKGIVYAITESETQSGEVESSTISPDPTTYYTTFTYFTTSYIGNETVLNSRLETITSVAYPGEVLKATGRAIGSPVSKIQHLETEEKAKTVKIVPTKTAEEPKTGLISTIRSSAVADGTTTHYMTDVYGTYIDGLYAQLVQSTTSLESHSTPTTSSPVAPTSSLTATPALPTGILSLNKGSIVDADQVTTVYFTTSKLGTLIDGLYAQVIESTSSTRIDADKKLQLKPTEERHRTGLVRLIKGQIESNGSTIVYQSKVIGTSIEGRYAQIIESTSSYSLGSTDKISPTVTSFSDVTRAPGILSPTPAVIQSSIPDNNNNNEDEDGNVEEENEEDEEENEDEGEDDDSKTKKKSRLTFSSRKRTFTPVIRPFLSRSRPTFNPKRKGAQGATTITRTDITPTITATLAGTKSNRFASSRGRATSSSVAAGAINSSRRFSGRRGSSSAPQASSTIAGSSRGRQPSRISPSPTFSVNRRGPSSIRGSSARPLIRGSSSSSFPGSSTRGFRGGIRSSSTLLRSPQSVNPTQLIKNDDQEDEANEFTATTLVTDETPYSTIDDEFGETITTVPVKTTTESSRRSTNPLLRFRRPNQLSRGPPPTRRTTTTTKPTPVSRTSNARSLNAPPLNNRFRGNNRLFAPRNYINQPTVDPEEDEDETTEESGITGKNFEDDKPVEEIVDNDYEGSENNKRRRNATTTTPAPQRLAYGNRFGAQRRRVKRQASQLRSYQNNRYRRPGTLASAEDRSDIDTSSANDESLKTNRSPFTGRTRLLTSSARPLPKTSSEKYSSAESSEAFKSRRRPTSPRVKPTPTTSSGRQFTLREKSSSGYKRISPVSKGNLRGSNTRARTTTRRTDTSYDSRRGSTARASSRGRPTSRRVPQRGRGSKEDYSYNKEDGTITVTHYVPTQATIPIYTNGVTEHRNIITASPSVEVLGPERYNTINGGDGLPIIVIASESSAVNLNGQTEVTRFLLHTTPTSRVSHTLTTINGRRVSQSLIVPSTIYSVENVVSTIPAALPSGNAPLANILLSQLLLGQLGGQNALLGATAAVAQADVTPTTTYNTRTTSYVTTITKQRSTVIPLTFRGKEIFTTLVDTSTDVITATEFLTDTVIVTPTAAFANANLNSLLLLLQQQPQASQFPQFSQQLQDPLFAAAPLFTQSNSLPGELERRHQPADLDYRPEEGSSASTEEFDKPVKPRVKLPKKETPESSVVTIYVSGKRPGEFSTILSTVKVKEDSTASRNRRDLIADVQPSIPPSLIANSGAELNRLSPSEESINAHSPTQSLESVVDEPESFFGQKYPIDDADLDDYAVRRKVIRIPVIRTTEKHKYTVVRRRPLVTYSQQSPISEEQQTSTPRRIVVTRVRSLAARSRHFSNFAPNYYDEPVDYDVPKRHKVTITRTRKLQPTITVEPTTTPRRIVRKKLVNVRPIITPTPTFAIITTGFYGIPSFENSDEDYESEEQSEGTTVGTNVEDEARLVNDIDEATKIPLEASKGIEEEESEEEKKINVSSITEPTPVIITDHFFFPASEDDDDEDDYEELPEQTTLSNVDQIQQGEENTTPSPVEEVSQDPVTVRTTEKVPEETTIPIIDEAEEQTTMLDIGETTVPPLPQVEEESSEEEDGNEHGDIEDHTEQQQKGDELPLTTEITIEDSQGPSPHLQESTISNDFVTSSTRESTLDALTVVPLESSLDISPTSILDFEVPTVIPLESLIPSSEEITPTSTIRASDSSTNTTTVVSSSPTPEEIEAGLSDELYLSLSRLNIPNISSSQDVEVEEKNVEVTPTVIFSETVVTSTRLRTYTYVVTKLNGLETQVTSSTTVRPRVTTLTLTVPITIFPSTIMDSMSSRTIMTDHREIAGKNSNVELKMHEEGEGRRLNLATRVMSNGVEVIVAGPTPALRWENSNPQPTLTLSDAVVMMMPQEDPNEFVTKTCTTTFTYLNTITKDGTTIVSTDQQVVANTATEERYRKPGSESAAVTLEASPTLRTEVFKTTYTYLTLNAEHPNADDALGSSQKVIANTVTAPQHYLDMILEPSETYPPAQTNTYLSTRLLEKTFVEDGATKIETISDTITRLIITESAPPPPRPTSVTTTLTALDNPEDSLTDIMKTYYITYTYANTYLEKGTPVIRTNVATSTDITVEKVPKKTTSPQDAPSPITSTANSDPIKIFATKTYLTTFTYFTTLLQAGADGETSTTISSRSHVVENVVTESIAPSLLNSGYMNLLTTTHRSDPVQNIVTGSTIIFFDDDDQIYPSSTTTHPSPSASPEHSEQTSEFPDVSYPEHSGANDKDADNDNEKNEDMDDAEANGSENEEVQTDLEEGPERPVSGLLSLGSLGINGLSALGPVITAMAGLLQGKPSSNNRKNHTVTTPPPLPNTNGNVNHLKQLTTQRSPIYIPVSEFADVDIETAESQNIVTQLTNPNFIPETRHKVAASLVDGIPISPGEIITANSDVIIGKPGKLSPRPPQTYEDDGQVGGLKPPPISVPNIPVHPVLEVLRDDEETKPSHVSHSLPQKKISDLLNKIPPRTSSKHDILENDPLLRPPGRPNIDKYANPNINHKEPQWLSDKTRKPWSSKDPIILPPPLPSPPQTPSRIDNIPHVYHQQEEGTRPPWAQKDPIVTVETLETHPHGENINMKRPELPESAEPIIHQVPHVIDRSTGQPLLVNIQPSQVANVVIPQGGTQALIFGDTSEPHISGQYFDDPSPYPEPEVGPSFDKFEENLSHYMLPPPTPGNFKAPNTFVHTIPISNSKIQGHFYDLVKPEKTPSDIRLIQRPDIHGQSQGHVHTEILVHHSPDNLQLRPQFHQNHNQNQNNQQIYVDLSPPPPPRMDYHKPTVNIEHLPPRRSELPSPEYSSHNFHRYNYHNHEKQTNKTLENEVMKQKWKNDRHKNRLQHRPRPSVLRRPHYPSHGNKIKFPGRPQPPKYPQIPIENLHKLNNNNKESENLPTGAIGYQNPLAHVHHYHVLNPHHPQVVQLPPDISPPEIQSFGQILPSDNEPESWSGTQTEKTIDSEAEESEDRPMSYYNETEGHQESQAGSYHENQHEIQQESQQEQEQEMSSPSPVLEIEESHPVTPAGEEFPSIEESSASGESSNMQQSDFYDYEIQISPGNQEMSVIQDHHNEHHHDHGEHHEENQNTPPTPIEDPNDYEVIQGVPIPQFDSKPSYEYPDDTIDLKPPAEPPRRISTPDKPDDPIHPEYPQPSNPPGGHARPPAHWSDRENQNYSNRKNLTQIPSSYLFNTQSNPESTNKKYVNTEILRKPVQSINPATRPHPAYPYIITKPPAVPRPVIISSDSHRNQDNQDKQDIHRSPSRPIIMQPAININKGKAPETLETAFQTNFASSDDEPQSQLPKTQHQQNQQNPPHQSHQRIESKIPSEDMMPPPQVKPLPDLKETNNNPEDSDLKPPPADTNVLGMSPPPVSLTNERQPPKYIPLKDSNKVVGETPPPPPPPPPPPTPSRPSYSMVPPTYPRPTKSRPYLVQLLSQDMVPPPVIESSRPIEIATVRPAIAVSGSIQIGTAVATSRIPVMQDIESTIPIVHGTVDLPVVVDVSDLMKTITETRKPDLISIYTVRPFETRQSKVSVQPTQILSTNLVMPTRIRTSPQGHRETVKKISPSSSVRSQVHITRVNPAFGPRKSVILEGSRHSITSRISPTPTKSLNHFSNFIANSSSSRNIDITSLTMRGSTSATQVYLDKFTEIKPKAVTHFKTLTVTRTETSVVGSPPTTRTLLLTSTITSTIVETVTETLLRPTSVVVTSVTTVLQSAQSTASVYDTYNSPDNLDSIFVVMSDQNPPSPGAEEVEAEYGSEEEVSRDEQDPGGNEIHKVLSGGILGAPVVPSIPHVPKPHECKPECRGFKSEVCANVGGNLRCVCRPGFARMFPDRPCKPTYTYTLKLPLDRVGREGIKYDKMALNNKKSSGFKRLMSSTREALDRTLMQSDLRDIYRGVDITKFHKSEDHPAEVEFHVQLTDNAHETTLKETIKKYLMSSNYSLGGTHVFASPNLGMIDARDFDECSTEEGGPYHDCSPNAACFNIRGSYQCSCKEGWADLSENPAYPGRICSQAPLGCPRCNNKGHCMSNSYGQEVCECFPWHSGQRCQVNLKVLLIALVTTGAILLGLLGVCLALACFRTPKFPAHKLKKSGRVSGDKRAMISPGNGGDTSSEGSVTDLAIPHHVPHVLPPPPRANAPVPPLPPAPPKETHQLGKGRHGYAKHHQKKYSGEVVEDKRGLSVMIPRAKYRSGQQGQYKQPITSFSADEHKLISYLEGSNRKQSLASTTKEFMKREFDESTLRVVRGPPNNGALVSAGFQVSATVTRTADDDSMIGDGEPSTMKTLRSTTDYQDGASTLARSCDATTIQATTKLIRLDLAEDDGENSGKQNSRGSKDTRDARDSASEGPITAERDLGSTLRLRHTPLYNPDRAVSDRDSNFDSL